ncbi:MAG: HAMP domain-containing protein [Leucobacter sp.]
MQEVDEDLLHSLDSVRTVSLGTQSAEPEGDAAAGAEESGTEPGTAPAQPETQTFQTPEQVVEATLAQVIPDDNGSSLGIVNGVPRFLSVAEVKFSVEDDPKFLERITEEVSDGSVRLGTYVGDLGQLRYLAVPITVEGAAGDGIFVTDIELQAELGSITTAFRTYAWVALISLVAIGVIGWFVAGRLLAPVRALRETASRISVSDLSERIPVSGNDDVSALTGTVNEMLERLESSMNAQG